MITFNNISLDTRSYLDFVQICPQISSWGKDQNQWDESKLVGEVHISLLLIIWIVNQYTHYPSSLHELSTTDDDLFVVL